MGQANRVLKAKRAKALTQARYGKIKPSKRWAFDGFTDRLTIPSSVSRVLTAPVERILLRNGAPV
jgi:hypothetical protein